MTLEITYDSPSPAPECGYLVKYRKNGAPAYTEVTTSGTTVTSAIAAPCCIEGMVIADCCSDNESDPLAFGINSYAQLTIEIVNDTDIQQFVATVTSDYGNPYDTIISGTINYTITGDPYTLDYTITYPAGETELIENLGAVSTVAIITSYTAPFAPDFDNVGELQLFDAVTTPDYFMFLSTSGVTWDGSPTSLPSFTVNSLIALEIEDEVVTQANLLCSWIYDSLYEAGVNPYDNVTFEVYDEDNALIGETRVPVSPLGLRNLTIFLQRADRDLNTSNTFTMVTKWDDDSTIVSKDFTLPTVTL